MLGCIHERASVAFPAAAASPRVLSEDLGENLALGGRALSRTYRRPQATTEYNGECCGGLITPITFPIKREKDTPYTIYTLDLVDA